MKTTWEEIQKSMTETYENYTQKKLLPGTVEEKSFRQLQVNYMHCRVTVILF